jgi:hypothetical protein
MEPGILLRSFGMVYSMWAIMPTKPDGERRSGTRIANHVSTRVRNPRGADLTAETRDVSVSGVFLYIDSKMERGRDVELVMILPTELASGEKCWVCCQSTIARVEEQGPEWGAAAQIRRMDILPEWQFEREWLPCQNRRDPSKICTAAEAGVKELSMNSWLNP